MKKNLLFGRILCLIMTMLIIGSSDLMGQTYQIGSGTNNSTSFPVVKNKEYSVS